MASVNQVADVVIVGGGISGLYTAWRLATSNPNLRIVLLEYTHRFGGRFQTCVMPGGFPADMGAMRYIHSMFVSQLHHFYYKSPLSQLI